MRWNNGRSTKDSRGEMMLINVSEIKRKVKGEGLQVGADFLSALERKLEVELNGVILKAKVTEKKRRLYGVDVPNTGGVVA